MFVLNEQLKKDCLLVGVFPLSQLLLMNDSQYPWFIQVPQRENITEIYQLSAADQKQQHRESIYLSEILMKTFEGDKLNIAALGNVVSQLHIHHVVRYRSDNAWPAPVWGKLPAKPYENEVLEDRLQSLRKNLTEDFVFNC